MPGMEGSVQTSPSDDTCHRYTDVSHWMIDRYSTAVEVKNKDNAPVEDQITEQMFGLFRNMQNAMLGIVVKPNIANIKVILKHNEVVLFTMTEGMSLLEYSTFRTLAKFLIAFFNFIDC